MSELRSQISKILDCLGEINRNLAEVTESLRQQNRSRAKKRSRAEAMLDIETSDTDTEPEAPLQPTGVPDEAPEAQEDGPRSCIKTRLDTPVIVLSEKPSGSRLYRPLVPCSKGTRSSARNVFNVEYSASEPLLDEDDLGEGEALTDTEPADEGFLNPTTNRVFRLVARSGQRNYEPIKTEFLRPTPEAPDFFDKKYAILSLLEDMGFPLRFGTKSNEASSDEMHHLLVIDPGSQRTKMLDEPKNGFMCDACNTRRLITHVWDDSINMGRVCAKRADFISDALRLIPRTQNDISSHGEAMFARLIAHAETLMSGELVLD